MVVATALAGALAPAASAHAQRSSDFDRGWKFALVNPADVTDPTGAYAHAADPGYDDSPGRTIDLPHDWSIELDPTPEGTRSDTGYFQGGLGWYRKAFTLPRGYAHKAVSLEFDGISMDSVVYLPGRQVAAHPYGYTGFAVHLKDAHADDRTKNVVAVQVRNKLPSSRWYSGSGIYRHVHLVVTEPTHVARHGTFVTTPGVESTFKQGFANVHVSNDVVGASEDTSVVTTVRADASYSGRPDTLPAAMLDGNPATAWSNYYLKAATALLPSFSLAHAKEWVSVAWPGAQSVGTVRASLIADATRALPADIAVKYWDGGTWVAVSDQHVTPASASGEPTEIMFDPVSTTRLRLDMTSAHPKAGNGFIAISALEVPAAAVQ